MTPSDAAPMAADDARCSADMGGKFAANNTAGPASERAGHRRKPAHNFCSGQRSVHVDAERRCRNDLGQGCTFELDRKLVSISQHPRTHAQSTSEALSSDHRSVVCP